MSGRLRVGSDTQYGVVVACWNCDWHYYCNQHVNEATAIHLCERCEAKL